MDTISVRILVPAKHLPDDCTVTKRTGEKKYTLQSVIMIHGSGYVATQSITARRGTRFLIANDGGDINVILDTLEVLVQVEAEVEPDNQHLTNISMEMTDG